MDNVTARFLPLFLGGWRKSSLRTAARTHPPPQSLRLKLKHVTSTNLVRHGVDLFCSNSGCYPAPFQVPE